MNTNGASTLRVLIIELAESHDEVLLSNTLDLLSGGHVVALACPRVIRNRLPIPLDTPWLEASAAGTLLARIRMALRVRRWCQEQRVSHVIVNTATGTTVRDVVQLLPRKVSVIGVLHDISKLAKSTNQRITEWGLDAYIVLADHLAASAGASRLPVYTVPPTAVPNVAQTIVLGAFHGTIHIAIPGTIQASRKDVDALLGPQLMQSIPTNVRFVILGDASGEQPERQRIREFASEYPDRFVLFNTYVDHNIMHAWLRQCVAVLPLIHPICSEYQQFLKHKASGAMALAVAHGIPILLEEGFSQLVPPIRNACYYRIDALAETIRNVAEDVQPRHDIHDEQRLSRLVNALTSHERLATH